MVTPGGDWNLPCLILNIKSLPKPNHDWSVLQWLSLPVKNNCLWKWYTTFNNQSTRCHTYSDNFPPLWSTYRFWCNLYDVSQICQWLLSRCYVPVFQQVSHVQLSQQQAWLYHKCSTSLVLHLWHTLSFYRNFWGWCNSAVSGSHGKPNHRTWAETNPLCDVKADL